MQASDVKKFAQTLLKQKLGDEYRIVSNRDLVRMRGPFVQSVLLGIKRSGSLSVIPTFYVIGADPSDEVMFQTMSLPMSGIDRDRRWLVFDGVPLDEGLADRLVEQLKKDSPLSYIEPLSDVKIHRSLKKFVSRKKHWAPSLSLAYWEILTGAKSAAKTLQKSKRIFVQYSRYSTSEEPLECERKLMDRYDLLHKRLDSVEGISQCRVDADAHAAKLKLPNIDWPLDWPN